MKNLYLLALFTLIINPGLEAQSIPAFPGAEGYGMYATGGRGGRVIEVTTLEDMDRYGVIAPGSFRQAVNTSGDDPITIVFRVSGTIELYSELKSSRSNMTIAGQTAPGDGICFKDNSIKLSGRNLIIRYIRFRPGDETKSQVSSLNIENAGNFIIDHCSFSWAVEENTGFYDNKYTTVQWCIISESLYDSYHSKGARGYAGQWGGQYASYHHNLLAHHSSRSPRINGCRSHDTIALNDFRNNIVYNWGRSGSIYGGEVEIYWDDPDNPGTNKAGSFNNFVNNYYKPGPATPTGYYFAQPSYVTEGNTAQGYAEWYINGNVMEGDADKTADNWLGIAAGAVGGIDNIKVDVEHNINDNVTTQSAQAAYDLILENAGAIMPVRDAVDERIVGEVKGEVSVTGNGIIDSQTEIGGWPVLLSPRDEDIPVDTDHDGIPDYWEDENSLDKNDPEDGKIITGDGYSNLEHYLNSDIPYIQGVDVPRNMVENTPDFLYPNPARSQLYVQDIQGLSSVMIYSIDGALIAEKELSTENGMIDISKLEHGIYLAKGLFKDGRIWSQKIVKE